MISSLAAAASLVLFRQGFSFGSFGSDIPIVATNDIDHPTRGVLCELFVGWYLGPEGNPLQLVFPACCLAVDFQSIYYCLLQLGHIVAVFLFEVSKFNDSYFPFTEMHRTHRF